MSTDGDDAELAQFDELQRRTPLGAHMDLLVTTDMHIRYYRQPTLARSLLEQTWCIVVVGC